MANTKEKRFFGTKTPQQLCTRRLAERLFQLRSRDIIWGVKSFDTIHSIKKSKTSHFFLKKPKKNNFIHYVYLPHCLPMGDAYKRVFSRKSTKVAYKEGLLQICSGLKVGDS